MKKKCIHFIYDEKFIDGAIELIETDDSFINTYAVCCNRGKKWAPKFVKNPNILQIQPSELICEISKYDFVFLHSLASLPNKFISQIPSYVKVIWYAWGFDLYECYGPFLPIELYMPITKSFLRKQISLQALLSKISNIRHGFSKKKVLERIDYFSGVYPYEYNMLSEKYSYFNAKPLDFYYGHLNFFIKDEVDQEIKHSKHNIIIGNSANPTNNHLDIFKYIDAKEIDPETKIIIPLSYSGNEPYRKEVIKRANEFFPGHVESLQSYMPLNDYLSLISNCKIAIFGHERQQASDNILLQILYGAKVYLSENSRAFPYFKQLGFKIYSLQSDPITNSGLSDEDIILNRQILVEHYSESTLIRRIKTINKILNSDNYDFKDI